MSWWSKTSGSLFILSLMFLSYVTPQPGFAEPSTPLAVIRSGTERALDILRSSRKGDAPALRQRKDEILVTVDEYFNFAEMARRSLGRPWKEQPPEKFQEFVRLFKQLLFNTYIGRVEKMTGADEKFFYDSERLDGDHALVRTHVVVRNGGSENIDYRLRREDGEWKVYDVAIEGISLIDNYKSQFASILAKESFDLLVRKLREKVEQAA